MNHRHSNLFYAALVLLVLTLAGFKFPDILKGPQKEKTAENDKPYVVSTSVINAIANVCYKWTIEKAKVEGKLIVDPEKKNKSFSKMFKGLKKKTVGRFKRDKKAKKEDKLTENEEEEDKRTEKADKEDKEDKPLNEGSKTRFGSRMFSGLKKAAKRLKSGEKTKKDDKLAENEEEEDKPAENEEEGDKLTKKADKEDKPINDDLKILAQVEKVFKILKEAAERSEYGETAKKFKWEVNVIKDDKIENAFTVPGGKITIYTGILTDAYCKNEEGLAAVLGHEMTHALAQHHFANRFSKEMIDNFPLKELVVAGGALAIDEPEIAVVMVALGLGSFVTGVDQIPFAQDNEAEADYKGLLLVANAGYEPLEASGYWSRMLDIKDQAEIECEKSHPSSKERYDKMSVHLKELMSIYNDVKVKQEKQVPLEWNPKST